MYIAVQKDRHQQAKSEYLQKVGGRKDFCSLHF